MSCYVIIDNGGPAYEFYAEFQSENEALIHIHLNEVKNWIIIDKPQIHTTALEKGRLARLVVSTAIGQETYDFQNLEDAIAAINVYHPNDGVKILSVEQPIGSAPTYLLYYQPCLWKEVA